MISNTEMITISRAEYEAMRQQVAQVETLTKALQKKNDELQRQNKELQKMDKELLKKDEELQKKTEELTSSMLQNQWFMERLRLAAKQKFGRSSEQVLDGVMEQLSLLANEAEAWDAASYVTEVPKKEQDGKQKGTRKRRSGSIQDVIPDNLQVEYVHHDLPEEEQNCPICQAKMVQVGVEEHHSLKIIPPQFIHQIDVYPTYNCEECLRETDEALFVKTPKEPTVFPGSFASPEAVAYLMTQKYVMHSPLYRLEQEINRADIKLSRQTMSNWILHCSNDWLKPIYDCMKKNLVEQNVLHADETTVQVLREAGKSAVSKSYMWLYRTDRYAEKPIILYDYQPDRKAKRVTDFLGNWSGWLHTDGYSGYHGLPKEIQVVGCWAHTRRKFDEAVNSLKKEEQKGCAASVGEAYCSRLFQLEEQFADLTPEERYAKRLEQEKPVLDALLAWAYDQKRKTAPKSALGKAIAYLLNQWEYLTRYLEDGRLVLSNNLAERSIKPFVMGRKNWLFSNTPAGAQASAVIFSVIETAKATGLDPYQYLLWVLQQAPKLAEHDPNWAEKLLPEMMTI